MTYQTSAVIAPTHEQAVKEYEEAVARIPELGQRGGGIIGTPDEVGETYTRLLASGVDGFTVNLPANGHIEGRVSLLGETLTKVLGG